MLRSVRPLLLAGARTGQRDRQIWTVIRPLLTTCVPAHIWPTRGRSGNGRRVHALGSAPVEERCNQREHFAGPQCHADVRGLGSTASCVFGRSSNISATSGNGEKSQSPNAFGVVLGLGPLAPVGPQTS